MRCPVCKVLETRVLDTRSIEDGRSIRRRRECPECSHRFTTYEKTEEKNFLWVMKKDGSRESFDKDKLLRGLIRACEKRAVPLERLEEAVASIELKLKDMGGGEVSSIQVGELAMDLLERIDKVAYVRFASVYREFSDLSSFTSEIAKLIAKKGDASGVDYK